MGYHKVAADWINHILKSYPDQCRLSTTSQGIALTREVRGADDDGLSDGYTQKWFIDCDGMLVYSVVDKYGRCIQVEMLGINGKWH